jgi:ABC-type multidrug transport system fused ATPase/permease subunit
MSKDEEYITFGEGPREIRIKRFDMSRLNTAEEGRRVLIVGMRGTGMSTMAASIMRATPIENFGEEEQHEEPPLDNCQASHTMS